MGAVAQLSQPQASTSGLQSNGSATGSTQARASTSQGQTQGRVQQKVTHSPRIAQHPCTYCGDQHFIVACPKFRELTPVQRKRFVTDKPLCFNCLGTHPAKECRSTYTCRECNKRHHTMIHLQSSLPNSIQGSSQSSLEQ